MTSAGSVTVIKKFTSATEGGSPFGSLVFGTDGLLYGMTYIGGKFGGGTVFKLTIAGSITLLSHLNGAAQGNSPQNDLALGKDSAYFGVARLGGAYNFGTVFKICGGVTTLIRSFNRNADGAYPMSGLLRAKDGNLYGTTSTGGLNSGGTIYRITSTGSFSILRHLSNADGAGPEGRLVQGP